MKLIGKIKGPWIEKWLDSPYLNVGIDRDNYSTLELFYRNLSKDKNDIEKLKKECDEYFSSLGE